MKGESSQKRSSGREREIRISNSRAMGVIVLIALLFVFQVVTFVWHKAESARLADGVAVGEVAGGSASGVGNSGGRNGFAKGERFPFDPNTISADSLQLLGFSPKQAQSILKYRSKGGKFRWKEDFSRLYVVDSVVYAALEEYIALPHRGSGTKGAGGVPGSAGVGTNKGVSVPGEAKNSAVGTKGAGGVPGGAGVGTNKGVFVPGEAKNSAVGTKGAGGVPGSAGVGTNKGVFVPDSRKSADPGRESGSRDSSGREGSIYGKKVEKNRYMCNLNVADSAALVQLYGIGGYYARKILNYRERLGGSFVDIRQLLEIEGFTQERFSKIEKNVFVNREDVKGFSILKAEREVLERHPYIGPYAARGIVTYLKLKGKDSFESETKLLQELVKEKVISEGNAQKLKEYLLHL